MKKVVAICHVGLGFCKEKGIPTTHWSDFAGKPAIWHVRERARRAKRLDKIVLYAEDTPDDQAVKSLSNKWDLDIHYIKDLNCEDNIEIFQKFLEEIEADVALEIGAHFPLVVPENIDLMVEYFISKELDFLHRGKGGHPGSCPTVVYSRDILKRVKEVKKSNFEKGKLFKKEWVGQKWVGQICTNPDLFKIKYEMISPPSMWQVPLNFLITSSKGFSLVKRIYKRFYVPGEIVDSKKVAAFYREDPEWFGFLPGSQIELEVTNDCNLKCIICPRTSSMNRGIGYMDFELFKKIIDGAEALSVHFSGLGEPLLHSQIKEMFTYAKEKGLEVGLWTNGLNLDEKLSREIIEKELLDYIIFGLDATTKEAYVKVKGIDAFDKAVENINKFLNLKKEKIQRMEKEFFGWWGKIKPVVGVQILKMKETDAEIEEFMNRWDYMDKANKMINYRARSQELSKMENELERSQTSQKLNNELWKTFYDKFPPVEHAIIGHFNNFCGQIEDRSAIDVTPLKRFPCRQLSSSTILWNGDVLLCRQDINGEYLLGNLREQNMVEISKKIEEVWQAHRDRKYDKIPLCANCKEWYYDLYA